MILSGNGSDGARGLRALKEAGGTVMAQAPETARYDGMPRSALETGLVDSAGAPEVLAERVMQVLLNDAAIARATRDPDEGVMAVLDALRTRHAVDLSYLRTSMLGRRTQRRMMLLGITAMADYVDRLVADPAEARLLIQDTMMRVSGFFRDPDAFAALQASIGPSLLRSRADDQFRVWVPACASGEEAYSIAILVLEALEVNQLRREVKILATDIDLDSLAFAGRGVYPGTAAVDLGPSRMARFFDPTPAGIAARKELRDRIVFARHNLVMDPPYTRIDLVSCRNLLIYLNPEAQRQVLGALHFALRSSGLLFLGSAESLGDMQSEFHVLDPAAKLYRKRGDGAVPMARRWSAGQHGPGTTGPIGARRADITDENHRAIIEALATSDERSIALLSTEGSLIDIIADPLALFRLPTGRPSADVLRLLVPRAMAAVTAGLQRLRRGEPEGRFDLPPALDDDRPLVLRLQRLAAVGSTGERVLLVAQPARRPSSGAAADPAGGEADSVTDPGTLAAELMQTRESLRCSIEELQSANEEQQSTNEELVASNEELQRTNDELQSVNEELFTVNVEYRKKHEELTVLAADLENLLNSITVGVLFLDASLKIRKFTARMAPIVELRDLDVGRSIEHFTSSLGPDFVADVSRVLETGEVVERERRSLDGAWLLLRIRPYRTELDQQQGVVATFFDVTPLKNAHEVVHAGSDQLSAIKQELAQRREEVEEMFSIVAHDLKRPVVALDGLLWLMADKDEAGEEPGDLLARAQRECHRMRQMLLDLEGIAGILRREIAVEDVSLQSWLDELVGPYRADAESLGIRINCTSDIGHYVLATGFLAEIVGNLIENAVKYGSSNQNPRIDVSCRVNEGTLELAVSDNGPGIAGDDHRRVFEPFRRLDPSAAEGSGVGLMAVKRLVQRLGGTIDLVSARGQGAKFTARVPLSPALGLRGKGRNGPRCCWWRTTTSTPKWSNGSWEQVCRLPEPRPWPRPRSSSGAGNWIWSCWICRSPTGTAFS